MKKDRFREPDDVGKQLRKLIDKYGGRSYRSIAREMARIDSEGYDGDDYDEFLERRFRSCNSNLNHYKKGKRRPELKMLTLLSKAIGCSFEELRAIFHP